MRSIFLVTGAALLFTGAASATAACSSNTTIINADDGGTTTPTDASTGADVIVDGGVDARYENTFPAPHAAIPNVLPQSGVPANVIAHPKIVTIGYDSDSARPELEAFTDAMVGSAWWKAATHEYCGGPTNECIGDVSVGAHVSLSQVPTALDTAQVESYLYALIANGSVPAPSPGVLYTFFFPQSVTLGEPGFEGCSAFDGYHSFSGNLPPDSIDAGSLEGGAMPQVAYAVVARCSSNIREATLTAAHEWIEASTDPDGYGYTVNDAAWSAFFYPEVGDLCDFEPENLVGKYTVQSGFSNAAANAGKNPCVPNDGKPYFNAAPEKNLVKVAVGDSITINVMPYSEQGAGEFTLDALDLATLYQKPAVVDAVVADSTVKNGLPTTVTLTLLSKPEPLQTGQVAAVVALRSTQGKTSHYWPILVAPK